MSHYCPHCNKGPMKSLRGLTQHIYRTPECRRSHDDAAGTQSLAAITKDKSLTKDKSTTDDYSTRKREPKSNHQAQAYRCSTLEVADVDVSSVASGGFPEADNPQSEPEDDDSEASDAESVARSSDSDDPGSEGRDETTSSEDEASQSTSDSRDSTPPNSDILEEFVQFCHNHHTKGERNLKKEQKKSVELMDILRRSKAPLSSFQATLEWHLKETGELQHWQTLKDTDKYKARETLIKDLSNRYNCQALKPKIKKVRLPFSKSVANIPVREAKDVIVSLLTDPRIRDKDYLFFDNDPLAAPPEHIIHLEDLNTGDAYLKTFDEMIKEKGEVLLPVPMYIDGAVTGQFSDLPLTPVKLALGIHKRETRDKDYAWRELGWIPQIRKQMARGKKIFKESGHLEARNLKVVDGEGDAEEVQDPEAREERRKDDEDEENEVAAQDFHTMLRVTLKSFVELQRTGFVWDLVYKGKLYKNIRFKIFVPFVKCDTEEADMLCGKYKIRTRTVKHICRYCHCPTLEADDPRVKHPKKKPQQIQKLVDKEDLEALKAMSQQCIQNAWYKVGFHKANEQGIHGACPSEMLHAILLGIFKYVREAFFEHMGKTSQLADDINGIAKIYGRLLTRQSDRSLPKTNFSKGIQKGKLMAKEFRGVLLIMAAVVHSTDGRSLLKKRRLMGGEDGITDWSMLIETLLEWEAFLNLKRMRKDDVVKLKKKMVYLMYLLRNVARRYTGMGLKLMKFHALVHLVEDILLYGVPSEFDTGSNESHHKPSKYAAKLTQRNEATFIIQAAIRITEFLVLDLALHEVNYNRGVFDYFGDHLDEVRGFFDSEMEDIEDDMSDYGGDSSDSEADSSDSEADDSDDDANSLQMQDRVGEFYFDSDDEETDEEAQAEESDSEDVETTNGGTRIRVFLDPNKNFRPNFRMLTRSKKMKEETEWDDEVQEFLCGLQTAAADYLPDRRLDIFTEHRRDGVMFRGHPNYRSLGEWRDWVVVDWGADGKEACHIWCYVELQGMPNGKRAIEHGGIKLGNGTYAVVESAKYDDPEKTNRMTDLFTPLTLHVDLIDSKTKEVSKRKFYLANADAFLEPCTVIPDIGGPPNAYFQVKPRTLWAGEFIGWLRRPHKEDSMDWTEFDDEKKKLEEEIKKKEAEKRKKQEEKEAAKRKKEAEKQKKQQNKKKRRRSS